MNSEDSQYLKSLTDEDLMDLIDSFNTEKQIEFIESGEFQKVYIKNKGQLKYLEKNVKIHKVSFILKLVLDGIAEISLDDFRAFLESFQERIYRSKTEDLKKLIDELNKWEETIPLPALLIAEELSVYFNEDGTKEVLKTESLMAEWAAIRESCLILKGKASDRLKILEDEDFIVKTSDNISTEPKNYTTVKKSKADARIFHQIKSPEHLNYLITTYKDCRSKEIVPMLLAITDLGLISNSIVFSNKTKLHKELQDLFGYKDTVQALNKSINSHNAPNYKQRQAIKDCKKEFNILFY